MFDQEVLRRHNGILLENSPDEILETVKEVDALADGAVQPEDELLEVWRQSLGISHYYGSGRPSHYFLEKHRTIFLS